MKSKRIIIGNPLAAGQSYTSLRRAGEFVRAGKAETRDGKLWFFPELQQRRIHQAIGAKAATAGMEFRGWRPRHSGRQGSAGAPEVRVWQTERIPKR